MNDRVETLIRGRRERLARLLLRPLETPSPAPESPLLSEEARRHLVSYAEELYWNDIEWENVTEEEAIEGGAVAQLVFPGFLAFVRGLLLDEVMEDAMAPAEPRPEVVKDVLRFLGRRIVELEESLSSGAEDPARTRDELRVTDQVLDLVLYRFHGLTEAEVERLEEARASEDAVAAEEG